MLGIFSSLKVLTLDFNLKCGGRVGKTPLEQREAETKESMENHEKHRRKYAGILRS